MSLDPPPDQPSAAPAPPPPPPPTLSPWAAEGSPWATSPVPAPPGASDAFAWTPSPLPARKPRWPWVVGTVAAAAVIVVVVGAVFFVGTETDQSTDAVQIDDRDGDGSTRPSVPLSRRPADAELYEGDGYTIYVDESWSQSSAVAAPIDALWFVDSGSEFNTNVNVLTERLPVVMDLDAYADLSIKNAPTIIDSELRNLDRASVELANGDLAERIEWSTTMQGLQLRFLQVIVVDGRTAIVVTLSALEDDFATRVAEAEPYLLTVVAQP